MDGLTDPPQVSDASSRGAKQSELLGGTRTTPLQSVSQERLLDLISLNDAPPARPRPRPVISADRRYRMQLGAVVNFAVAAAFAIAIAFTDIEKGSSTPWMITIVCVMNGLLVLARLKWQYPK